MSDREYLFSWENVCDGCGNQGAYDFMGDYYCVSCMQEPEEQDGCGDPDCLGCYPAKREMPRWAWFGIGFLTCALLVALYIVTWSLRL